MSVRSIPNIVIIDDNIKDADSEPLVGRLEDKYGPENVRVFQNVIDGINFINSNLSSRIIVLLDIMFGNKPEGLTVFETIANRTSLVYFIVMTGNFESVNQGDLVNLVNKHAWYLIKRDASSRAFLDIIDRANSSMNIRIDGALEEWILRHSDDDRRKPYIKNRSGKSYNLNDLLQEIRLGSDIGNEFAYGIINLAIDLLSRDKAKI